MDLQAILLAAVVFKGFHETKEIIEHTRTPEERESSSFALRSTLSGADSHMTMRPFLRPYPVHVGDYLRFVRLSGLGRRFVVSRSGEV